MDVQTVVPDVVLERSPTVANHPGDDAGGEEGQQERDQAERERLLARVRDVRVPPTHTLTLCAALTLDVCITLR